MKVAKFGGSSLSSASQIRKVANIIRCNPSIRAVVVSAPGKRSSEDTKVTDLLIHLHHTYLAKQSVEDALQAVLERYHLIVEDLALSSTLLTSFEQTLRTYLDTIEHPARLSDALKACGEDFNAQVVNAYLNQIGLSARYVSPLEAGIRVTDEPGNARLLESSYTQIAKLANSPEILVIPGFFGYSLEGDIVTFSRGGSDISGSIIASGLNADIYENYTDETFIYAAHPGKISNPYAVKEMTYREMRELAYAGFGIFHDEALAPVYHKKIPVMIRNTNDPEVEGTKIVPTRALNPDLPVVGISTSSGFLAISLGKYLLNRELGFTRRLLEVFERHRVSVEQMPAGIDNMSIIIRESQFASQHELDLLVADIKTELQPETLSIERDLTVVAIVGEGMRDSIGIASKATSALANARTNIRMISQGASEINMIFVIPSKDEQPALESLYHTYFGHLS